MSSNDQTIRSSELSQLVLGGSSELPTTAAAQASNPLLFKQAKGTNSASASANTHAHANALGLQDVSDMDAAQASQLLKHKHRGKKQQEINGSGAAGGGGGATRYRRQVRRNYHDIIDSEMEIKMKEKEDQHHYQHQQRRGDESGEDDQEDSSTFNIRKSKAGHGKQSKAAAGAQAILDKVVKKGRSDKKTADTSSSEDDDEEGRGRNRRRRRGRDRRSASTSSSSSSSDDDSSVERRRRVRERRARSRRSKDTGSGRDSNSSSSSSSDDDDDEADQRRNRMRAKMVEKRRQQEMKMPPPPKEQSQDTNGKGRGKGKGDESESDTSSSEDDSRDRNRARVRGKETDAKAIDKTDGVDSGRKPKPRSKRRSSNSDDSSSSSDDDSDSSDSDSSSSSSSEESEEEVVPLTSIAKPMFVPKHRRGKEQEEKQRLSVLADREEKDNARTDRRIKHSRALVAEIVAMETNQKNMNLDGTGMDDEEGGDEFANGSSTLVPPNDSDDVDISGTDGTGEGGKEFEQKAWEVRELLRLLRDFEEIKLKEQEIEERERRRNMTDQERYEEDVKAGKYRKPGEQRQNGTGSAAMAQNQRYFHRGAFYMDEDTLQDKDDIRHRAAEYAQAATGDIIFDKSKMPKIMQQSKQFGLAGNTRYKGLAKEDTSTRDSNYLPIYKGKKRSRDDGRR